MDHLLIHQKLNEIYYFQSYFQELVIFLLGPSKISLVEGTMNQLQYFNFRKENKKPKSVF